MTNDRETMARYWTHWYEKHLQEAAEARKLAEEAGAIFPPERGEAARNVEPTQDQLDAAWLVLADLYRGDGGWIGKEAAYEQARLTWRAMIGCTSPQEGIREVQPEERCPKCSRDFATCRCYD